MKEMFYSEILDKYFDSKSECRRAELQYQLDKQEKEKAAKLAEEKRKEETAVASKEKKALADVIEDAEKRVTAAQNDYQVAYDKYKEKITQAKEAYAKAVEDASNELTPAKLAIKEAQKARYEAIKAFNDKYGTYTVAYTGDKAYREMQKTINAINDVFNAFWF